MIGDDWWRRELLRIYEQWHLIKGPDTLWLQQQLDEQRKLRDSMAVTGLDRIYEAVAAQPQWQQTILDAIEQQASWQLTVQPFLEYQKQMDAMGAALQHLNLPDAAVLDTWLKAYRQQELEAFRAASELGWFVLPEFRDDAAEEIAACEGQEDRIGAWFADQVERAMTDVEARLVAYAPHRAEFIHQAFDDVRAGRYITAVPLLLLTADGIALDATAHSPFNAHSKQPALARWLQAHDAPPPVFAAVLQLAWSNPFVDHVPGLVNRHNVLHGRDLRYHTRDNALRAVSYLGSLVWVLADLGAPSQPT